MLEGLPNQCNDEGQKHATLSPEEIKKLAVAAGRFVRNHPPVETKSMLGDMEISLTNPYTPDALMDQREVLSPAIGKRFDAHGIAKGSLSEQLEALDTLLTTGLDAERPFHTTALRLTDEEERHRVCYWFRRSLRRWRIYRVGEARYAYARRGSSNSHR